MPQRYTRTCSPAQILHLTIEEVALSVQSLEVTAQSVEASTRQTQLALQEHGWLSLWHLLSLDAPTVATIWTWFVARAAGIELPAAVPVAMFVAVWLLYAGDRLLDGTSGDKDLEERHRFHQRHRRGFVATTAAAFAILIPLVLAIPWGLLKLYLELAGLLFLWFTLVHGIAPRSRLQLPKELMPGVFCAAAIFMPVWATIGFQHGQLAFASLCFGLLVTLNCWTIFAWEHDEVSEAHSTTQFGVRWLREATVAGVLIPLAASCLAKPHLTPIFFAIALAAGLLWMLGQARAALRPTDLRAAADLVLLTPLLIAAALR